MRSAQERQRRTGQYSNGCIMAPPGNYWLAIQCRVSATTRREEASLPVGASLV